MLTDYKFWFIRRDDNGFITEVAVKFFEGDLQIVDGKQVYVRTRRLDAVGDDLKHLATQKGLNLEIKTAKDSGQNDAVIYRQEDFGQIKTDEELRLFMNKQIQKDPVRIPIDEQREKK